MKDARLSPEEIYCNSDVLTAEELDGKKISLSSSEVGMHSYCPVKCTERDGKLLVQVLGLPASPDARISGTCYLTQEGIEGIERAPKEEMADFRLL
jgi:hypothetical protein